MLAVDIDVGDAAGLETNAEDGDRKGVAVVAERERIAVAGAGDAEEERERVFAED